MKSVKTIVEKQGETFFVRVEGKGKFMPGGYGITLDDALSNLRKIILDYQIHEGKSDLFWKDTDVYAIKFDLNWDTIFSEIEYNEALKHIDRLISENFESNEVKRFEFLEVAKAIQLYEKKYYPLN